MGIDVFLRNISRGSETRNIDILRICFRLAKSSKTNKQKQMKVLFCEGPRLPFLPFSLSM